MPQKPNLPDLFDKRGMAVIKRLVYLLDEQFRVPGTNFRFGLDPLMNLFPVVGDMTGFLISAGLLLAMARKGAGNKLVILMSINIFLDATIGGIPFIGQVFDFFFKANSRNLKLMKEHYIEGKHQGSGRNALLLAAAILFSMLILFIYLLFKLTNWIVGIF
jgi:NAD/NADP transhydrogenase beta subunit